MGMISKKLIRETPHSRAPDNDDHKQGARGPTLLHPGSKNTEIHGTQRINMMRCSIGKYFPLSRERPGFNSQLRRFPAPSKEWNDNEHKQRACGPWLLHPRSSGRGCGPGGPIEVKIFNSPSKTRPRRRRMRKTQQL